MLLHGRRTYLSTGIYLTPAQWQRGIVTGHPLANKLNAYLQRRLVNLQEAEIDMFLRGTTPSLALLRQSALSPSAPSQPVAQFAARVITAGSSRCRRTVAAYRSCMATVEQFHPRAALADIDYDWLTRFWAWMAGRHLAHNTRVGKMRCLRAVIAEAVRRRIIRSDDSPFLQFRIPSMKPRLGFLTERELRRLQRAPLLGREAHVRDAFLFAAYTGLRYGDLISLQSSHLRAGWIVKTMQKTGTDVHIPYRQLYGPRLQPILDSYPTVEDLCRIGHNAAANRTLRALTLRILGRPCTLHMARHSFAVNLLARGLPITTVQKLLGHAKLETTQVYTEVTAEVIQRDIKRCLRK